MTDRTAPVVGHAPRWVRWAVAAAAAGGLAAAAVWVPVEVSGGGARGTSSSASCASTYSPDALDEVTFALDGTVAAIDAGGQLGESRVTFEVHEWFRGGSGAGLTADMTAPGRPGDTASSSAQLDMPGYDVGTRLLVAGASRWGGAPTQDAVVWGCGFTRPHDEATARVWARALE